MFNNHKSRSFYQPQSVNVSKLFSPIGITPIVAFILLLSIEKLHGEVGNHCIWYGTCGEIDGKIVNCANNGTGKLLTDTESQDTMFDVCPELYTNRTLFPGRYR